MSKTKRIIAAVTAAIITATSASLMSVFADENGGSDLGFVSSGTKAETDNNEKAISEAQLYDKLGQLLKDGDLLKYGEALYKTGTPDGEKWTKEFYEKRVDFYGEEFLAKYIVNGEFLRTKVVSDMEELTTKENNSGLKEISEDINEYMRSNGISGFIYVREVDGVEKIFISYDGFYEKIKAYVVDTGVDESLVVYQQSQDYVMASEKSVKEFTFDEVNTMSTEEVVTIFAEKGLTKDNGYFVYGQGDEAEYIYTSTWNIYLFAEDYLIDKTVEEIITDYPPYQNGSCIYDKGESLWDSDRIVSSLALPEEYFEVTVFKNRVIVKGADSTDKYKIACNCEIRCKLPEGQERAAMRNAALNYLQLRKDFDKLLIDDAVPYYGKEKTAAQKYGDSIAEYMANNDIQGVVSRSVPDEKLSIGFHGDHEAQLRAYVSEIGLDKSGIPYEFEKLPDFSGFNDLNVTTVTQPKVNATTTTETQTPDVEKVSALKETAEDINEYMRSNGISGSTHVHEDDGVEKIFITYDDFFEKIKAYVVGTGVDESLVVYQQSHDDTVGPDKSENENNLKVYADDISKYMLANSIAGDAFVRDDKIVVTYSAHEDKIKAYIKEKGIDESLVIYEKGQNQTSPGGFDAESLKGDANCDGQVDLSDAVMIMQALANPNKYGISGTAEKHLTEQGQINGDMDGDGLTVGDAQAIQRQLLGLSSNIEFHSSADYPCAIKINGTVFWQTNEKFSEDFSNYTINKVTAYSENVTPQNDGESNFDRGCTTEYIIIDEKTIVVKLQEGLVGYWIFRAK